MSDTTPLWLEFIWSFTLIPAYTIVLGIWNSFISMMPIVAVASVFQLLFPAVKRRPKILSHEMWMDIIYVCQTTVVYATIFGVAVSLTSAWLRNHSVILFPSASNFPYLIQVTLAIWLYDFVVYWRHRIEHQVSFIWPMHAIHHTSLKIDVLTTTRLHFLEVMLGGILVQWIGPIFGVSSEALMQGFSIYLFWNYFIHSNVKWKFPGFLKYVFVSPFMHRWHHSLTVRDKNFGVVFAWNDWLFGTAYHPNDEPSSYGYSTRKGEDLGDSYLEHQIYPFKVWAKRILLYINSKVLKGTEVKTSG